MLISIITINYNHLQGLEKTMTSVINQSYPNIEYIIIDGGSTDGSKSYIENFHQDLAYWVSEPDKGIYHAMNKGINQATGDYLLFLNSGDWLVSADILESIEPSQFSHDLISCRLHVVGDGIDYIKETPDTIRFSFLFRRSLPHQSTFIKKHLFETVGQYDENLKFVSDWKFFILAICKFKASFYSDHTILSNYNLFGFSSIQENYEMLKLERQNVLMEEFGTFYKDLEELSLLRRKTSSFMKSRWVKVLLKMRLINKF